MSEVILAVLQRPETAAGVLRAAERLATLAEGGCVSALAIQVPLGLTRLMGDGSISNETLAVLEARERQRVASLKDIFDGWAAAPRAASALTLWSVAEGNPDRPVLERGRRADFVVIARPAAGDDWTVRQAFEIALFRTERPVLVVPPGMSERAELGRRVAIAWRDDSRAVKAVLPALRCLRQAEQVFVLAGVREGKPRPAMPEVLVEHGIAAEMRVLPVGGGVFGETLLSEAHALGADLLVMGAYYHSRLRELVFGGVTRFMLGHADLPVLMRH
jgi:nucleotide-binding universal stress UspA family protein